MASVLRVCDLTCQKMGKRLGRRQLRIRFVHLGYDAPSNIKRDDYLRISKRFLFAEDVASLLSIFQQQTPAMQEAVAFGQPTRFRQVRMYR